MIASHENQRFLYRETKIVLNNTGNESVYLRSATGLLIDTYSYSGTQRDDVVLRISLIDEVCSTLPQTLTGTTSTGSSISEAISGGTYTGTLSNI